MKVEQIVESYPQLKEMGGPFAQVTEVDREAVQLLIAKPMDAIAHVWQSKARFVVASEQEVSTLLHMMAKRRQGDRSGKASKCRDEESLTDRISKLPDDLLLSILSRLSFKEATMTSLLSQRWRYLWTFLPKLDFDGANLLMKVMSGKRRGLQLDTERAYFIRCVGHGMESSDYPIEQFRVFFNLNKECTSSIDKWLRHALARKVQRLELDFTDYDSRKKHKHEDFYTFPYTFLSANAGYFYRSSRYWSRRQCESVDFSSLRKIVMNCVNVSGKALEFFLHHCPLLEDLSVSESIDVSTLKITRPVRSFKRLEISFCHSLRKVEIRDANIVYLKFEGYAKIPFLLEGVPLLVEIYVGGDSTNILSNPFDMFEKCLPQIEIFTIQRVGHFYWIDTEFCETVNLSNLKQLVIKQEIFSLSDYSLLPLSSIIEVAPRLQRFVLEVMRWYPEFSDRRIHKFEGSYPHLKEVEIVGYCSVMSEVELLEHFMESAVALEKITLDPRKPCKAPYEIKPSIDRYVSSWMFDPKFKNEFARQEMDARTHAMKLNVPPGVNLQIL